MQVRKMRVPRLCSLWVAGAAARCACVGNFLADLLTACLELREMLCQAEKPGEGGRLGASRDSEFGLAGNVQTPIKAVSSTSSRREENWRWPC